MQHLRSAENDAAFKNGLQASSRIEYYHSFNSKTGWDSESFQETVVWKNFTNIIVLLLCAEICLSESLETKLQ